MFTALALCMLADFVAGPPLPTKEQTELVEKMGDDSFHVREAANKKLEDMGWKALRALHGATKHKDLEIARRAERSLSKYYNVSSNDKDTPMPSIWHLDNKLRWPNGETGRDLAKDYYAKVRNQYNKKRTQYDKISDQNWTEDYIAQDATRQYIKDLLWKGMSREKVKKRLNEMVENAKNMYNENGTYGHDENGTYRQLSPPGKLLKKEKPQIPQCPAGPAAQGMGAAIIRGAMPVMPRAIDK